MTDDKKRVQQNYIDEEAFEDESDDPVLTDLGESEEAEQTSGRGNQGFASMPKQKQREIASKGGKAAHEQGTAHEWDSAEAAEAGRKGGQSRTSFTISEDE